ncbi:MAG TPA: DUF6159 family protein [Candidatus Angelobacter sp.]|nr:DUF6159 family protein [Candidatus Angelobacter sp.]
MNRFERSWLLFRSSLRVIVRNKELLIFPIFISAATVVIFLFFFAPALLWPTGYSVLSAEHWHALGGTFLSRTSGVGAHPFGPTPFAIAYCVVVYFASMFTATFFNVAFYHEILAALNGESVSLGHGLQFACSRWKAILLWALFAGLIGLIIRAIEQRFEIVGRITAGLIGVAWSIASVFVIPVIVRDQATANPILILKKSAGTLKNAWGEGLIGYIGIGAINTIVMASSMVVIVAAGVISSKLHNFWLLGLVLCGWFLGMVVWSYLMNVAGLVYKGALYLYAAEGAIHEPFDQPMLDSAWKFKR